MHCPLGCDPDSVKCLDIAPSNGLEAFLDMAAVGPDIANIVELNTDDGSCVGEAGTPLTCPSVVFDQVRVFTFASLRLATEMRVTGALGLAIVSDGDVVITGAVDVSADGASSGPGATSGTCEGSDRNAALQNGAGGAGHAITGAAGGDHSSGAAGAAGGIATGGEALTPLRGGCTGGAGATSGGGGPGGAGGAVHIVSRTAIRVEGNGAIDASGGGGQGDGAGGGGAGGGSGGAVLLEAPTVVLSGAGVSLSTKGGGGAAARLLGGIGHGADGGRDSAAATGGIGTEGEASGGDGGAWSGGLGGAHVPPERGANGVGTNRAGGGGGGSAGRLRINTWPNTAQLIINDGAAIRSPVSLGVLETRLVPQ